MKNKQPIKIEDIEEFEAVRRIPRQSITALLIEGIKQLHEINHIELFLREIIPDKNDTPHSATEVVDILTTHLTYKNDPQLAAFINKGKSFPSVTAKNVSNQIFKLRRIPNLNLVIMLASGNIQDDAIENFLITANDINANYMIVDAIDLARLLIAYNKVCPKDCTPYVSGYCPKCGHANSEPILLTLNVNEKPRRSILKSDEVSHAGAKRYTADILTDPHYSKGILREIIKEVIWDLQHEDFYRSEETEQFFGEQKADCIFLFVFVDIQDVQNYNWICQAQWTNSALPKKFRPIPPRKDEQLGNIIIEWKKDYDALRKHWINIQGSKKEWIEKIERVLPQTEDLLLQFVSYQEQYRSQIISENDFDNIMGDLESVASNLYSASGNEKLPPIDCKECDNYFLTMMGSFHNIFIPFAKWSKVKRTWENKIWLMNRSRQQYEQEKLSFIHEWKKIRR